MSQRLVSILTPCCNGGKYINRLLDSILKQTHPDIEMVVIDDGSVDDSADIIQSYVSKFEKKGYRLTYVYQKNQGQSVAINNGLGLLTGKYIVWPDADDYYASPKAIATMVSVLEQSDKDTSMVRVQYNVLDEEHRILGRLGINNDTRYKTDLFEDAIFGANGFWYPPGGYMAKISKLDECVPGRVIYTEKNAGQNFQLYLPLLYKHKCITIEDYMYNIIAHDDSHSRNIATNNERQRVYYRTIKNTLHRIPLNRKYRKYLLDKLRKIMAEKIETPGTRRRYRTYVKKSIKWLLPYGVVVILKRRYH